jgi:hypothetical protein
VTGDPQHRQPYFNQFPWFAGIFAYGPAGFSNYHALQVTLVQRNFHGLTLNAAYTYARDLATPKGGNNPFITNSNCVSCEYGAQTPTHSVGITLVYALPGIKSPAQLLEGWQISSAINLQTGVPFRGTDSSNDFAGVNDNRGLLGGTPEQWSLYGKASDFNFQTLNPLQCYGFGFFSAIGVCQGAPPVSCVNAANAEPVNAAMNAENPGSSSGLASLNATGCYVSKNGKSVIIPPAQGTFGNMKPGQLIGPPFHEWDLSLRKAFKVHDRLDLEFSLSAFNVLNVHAYSLGFTGGIVNVRVLFGVSSGQPNDGNPVNGTGGARQVLLGLKATF